MGRGVIIPLNWIDTWICMFIGYLKMFNWKPKTFTFSGKLTDRKWNVSKEGCILQKNVCIVREGSCNETTTDTLHRLIIRVIGIKVVDLEVFFVKYCPSLTLSLESNHGLVSLE